MYLFIHLFISSNQAYIFEVRAQAVTHFMFQEGSPMEAEMFHWTRKVPVLLVDHNKLKAFVRKVRHLKFQGNPINGGIDTDEKVLCPSNKVPFIIDRMQPQLLL